MLAFVERSEVTRRWPAAHLIDTDFINRLKQFLLHRQTTRNGRANGRPRALTTRQCGTSWSAYGRPCFANPVLVAAVGGGAAKDPPPGQPAADGGKVKLVGVMDVWQLTHVGPLLVLPLRPEDLCGVPVGEVDHTRHAITFGTRVGGDDGTKCGLALTLLYPRELAPLFRANAADRVEGPLPAADVSTTRVSPAASTASSAQSKPSLATSHQNLPKRGMGMETGVLHGPSLALLSAPCQMHHLVARLSVPEMP